MRPQNRNYPQNISKIDKYKDSIIQLYNDGKTANYIAQELHIGRTSVGRYMKKLGLDTSRFSCQRDIPLSVNTKEIIELYNSGIGCYKLAEKFQCSESAILSLLKKNGIQSNQHLIKYSVNEKFFDDIQTEQQAYIYGFFVGDGCNQKNGVVAISITDLNILEDMKRAMGFTGPIDIHTRSNAKSHWLPVYRISIGCRYMSDRLTQIHCPHHKTYLTQFPSFDIVPKHLMWHYIRGVLDSDGSFYCLKKAPHLVHTSIAGTSALLTGIKNFTEKEIGVISYLYKHGEKCNILRITNQEDVAKFAQNLYKNSSIFLRRKYEKVEKFINI